MVVSSAFQLHQLFHAIGLSNLRLKDNLRNEFNFLLHHFVLIKLTTSWRVTVITLMRSMAIFVLDFFDDNNLI